MAFYKISHRISVIEKRVHTEHYDCRPTRISTNCTLLERTQRLVRFFFFLYKTRRRVCADNLRVYRIVGRGGDLRVSEIPFILFFFFIGVAHAFLFLEILTSPLKNQRALGRISELLRTYRREHFQKRIATI